jgi:hypothetical protein
MEKLQFDWRINVGNVITLVLLLIGIVAAFYSQQNKFAELERRVFIQEAFYTETRASLNIINREMRELYLSKDVADQIILRLDRIERRLDNQNKTN